MTRLNAYVPSAALSDSIQITELRRSGRGLSRFLRLPYSVYDGDPHWVAPILSDLKKVFFDSTENFQDAELSTKRIEFLREVVPNLKRLAIIWNLAGGGTEAVKTVEQIASVAGRL